MTEDKIEGSLRRIEEKLAAVERRLEAAAMQPRVLRPTQAALLMSCSLTKLRALVKQKKIRMVMIGSRRMVPTSEIVRLTSVVDQPRTPPGPRPRPTKGAYSAIAEAEAIRASKKRKR